MKTTRFNDQTQRSQFYIICKIINRNDIKSTFSRLLLYTDEPRCIVPQKCTVFICYLETSSDILLYFGEFLTKLTIQLILIVITVNIIKFVIQQSRSVNTYHSIINL